MNGTARENIRSHNDYFRQSGRVGDRRNECLSFGGTVVVDPRYDEKKGRNSHATSSVLGDTVESHIGGMVCRFCFMSEGTYGEVSDDGSFSLGVWWKRCCGLSPAASGDGGH